MYPRREIRREECDACRGQGRVCARGRLPCPTCLGVGWLQAHEGTEALCSQCKGFQQVEGEHLVPCTDCNAGGHFVVLVELSEERFTVSVACRDCKGEGTIVNTYKEEDEEHCEECGGSGHDVAYGIAHGIPIRDTRCPACRGRGVARTIAEEEEECVACGGGGTVMKVKTRVVETVISRRPSAAERETGLPESGPSVQPESDPRP